MVTIHTLKPYEKQIIITYYLPLNTMNYVVSETLPDDQGIVDADNCRCRSLECPRSSSWHEPSKGSF